MISMFSMTPRVRSCCRNCCWRPGRASPGCSPAVPRSASLPLNRLRLLNELLELDTQALKFSHAESHEFLCSAVGESLEPALSRLLTERTEGWVAGLQLASLGLRAVTNRAGLIHGFTGANRNVADFLRDTVLSNLDQGTHDFLLATSILPRLSVELCNFITGQQRRAPASGSARDSEPVHLLPGR